MSDYLDSSKFEHSEHECQSCNDLTDQIIQNAENSTLNGGMQSAIASGHAQISQIHNNYSDITEKYIEFYPTEIKKISKNKLKKEVAISLIIYLSACIFIFFIRYEIWFLLIAFVLCLFAFIRDPYLKMFLTRSINTEFYLGRGRFIKKDKHGDSKLYRKRANCIYGGCNGIVYLQDPPEKERDNHQVIGICNLGKKSHTYKIANYSLGYIYDFDFSLIKQNK